MKKRKMMPRLIFITMIGLFLITSSGLTNIETNDSTDAISLDQYSTVSPISITSDDEFSSNGFTGSGTYDDPYSLDGVKINGTEASNNYALSIEDTRAYVEITNNYFINGSEGIHLQNVTNIIVDNNLIEGMTYNGVFVLRSSNVFIQDNMIDLFGYSGIEVQSSNSVIITQNMIKDDITSSDGFGIELSYSTNETKVSYNTLSNLSEGAIQVRDSSYANQIIGNEISNIGDNFEAAIDSEFSAYNNTIESNVLSNIQGVGVELSGDGNNTVYNNTITNADEEAMTIYSSDNTIFGNVLNGNQDGMIVKYMRNNITENIVTNTSGDGIYLYGTTNTTVVRNVINGTLEYSLYLRYDANDSYIAYNNITHPDDFGLYVADSGGNEIVNNNFIGKTTNSEYGKTNTLDNDITSNYYDDHTLPDSDGDGIVDDPYTYADSSFDDIPPYNDTKPLADPVSIDYSLLGDPSQSDDTQDDDPDDDTDDSNNTNSTPNSEDKTETDTDTDGTDTDTSSDTASETVGTGFQLILVLSVFISFSFLRGYKE